MALWIPLGLFTVAEALDAPSELALLLVGRRRRRGVRLRGSPSVTGLLGTGALAFIVGVWFWAVDRAGALGAVLALAVTAAVLFRLSGRIQGWVGGEGPVG